MDVEGFNPGTLEEAFRIKSKFKDAVSIVAGGTDFMVGLKLGAAAPARVMDITGIDELKGIRKQRGGLFIGACTTFSDIVESGIVKEKAPVLHRASCQVGARQIRNRATLGGNVASGSPAADSLPALWVLNASVRLGSAKGTRSVPIRKFFSGYRRSVMKKDEILVGFTIPSLGGGYTSEFYKVGPRRAQAIAKVSLAAMVKLKGGMIDDVRLSAGSVAPVVMGLKRTEKYLKGKEAGLRVIEKARQLASAEVSPIDDVRSSALYRKTVTGNLVARFLEQIRA